MQSWGLSGWECRSGSTVAALLSAMPPSPCTLFWLSSQTVLRGDLYLMQILLPSCLGCHPCEGLYHPGLRQSPGPLV